MSNKLSDILARISSDPQVKAAEEAAAARVEKKAHQPEMGMPAGGVTRSPMDGMLGNTSHDARARAEELALEQAGRELEASTFDDPREAANARNLANTVGEEVKSPVDGERQDTSAANVHLPESPGQKMAALSFADYVEHCAVGEEGVKTASEALDPVTLREYQKTASLEYLKGANLALGHIAEAIGA